MSQQEILTITEIKDGINRVVTKYHGIKSVVLIGSYAHNTATGDSDIDLVIDLENEFDSKCFFDFWADAEGIVIQ